MTDQEQLIAVAEVLGKRGTVQEIPLGDWWRKLPPYLTSLDACFADIVPVMRDVGRADFTLFSYWPDRWQCQYSVTGKTTIGVAPTAPHAIVKAFLMHNNRWVDRPDSQRKGGND